MKQCIKVLALLAGALTLEVAPVFADGVDEPIPSFYQEPGLAQNRSHVSQHPNERIDPFTGNVSGNGVNTFTYNDASNMRCSGCGTAYGVDYDYDAGNMRVRSTPQGGTATYFVYGSSGNLLWELTPGVNLTEYVYLQGKQVATRQHTGG